MRALVGCRSSSLVLLLTLGLGAPLGCGDDSGGSSSSGGPSNGSGSGGTGSGGTGSGGSAGSQGSGGDEGDFTPTYARFGAAEVTFTLPKPAGEAPPLGHPNLMEEFPEVDWANLDRLYIPAGEYETVLLGGLPEREADHKLVITNLGGQVKVGGHAANFVMSIRGGKNWVLTGRYDPESRTGDAEYRGHAEGAFAHSQGTYGIFIDDAFSKEGHTGLAIGGSATDFEIDCIEVTRAEFAGIMAKTDDDGSATMRNVKLHDTYVHDVGSEGIYFGSTQAQPQHAFENLEIYDNRFLRTGTEALQVGQLGDGAEVHHNVLGPAAIRWRSAFQKYQDGNVQYGQRYGSSSFHHNIVIGTGDLFVELFPTVVAGDAHAADDTVTFADNYFSDTSLGGVYTHADDTGVNIVFENNTFRGFSFNYPEVYPDVSEPVQVFGVGSNSPNPHLLKDNRFEAPYPFIQWTFPSVTEENNTEATTPPVSFRAFMNAAIEANYRTLEWWTATATLAPGAPEVVYPAGAFVMHQGTLYEALVSNGSAPPDANPDKWKALEAPADDVRLSGDSPHAGLGLQWPPAE